MPLSKTRAYFLLVALFILVTLLSSVLDHAQTNFVNPWLWLPTAAGLFATFVTLAMGAFKRLERGDFFAYIGAMGLMILVGLVWTALHVERDLTGLGALLVERAINRCPTHGPPPFCQYGCPGVDCIAGSESRWEVVASSSFSKLEEKLEAPRVFLMSTGNKNF